jgi:CheY-like chemotaxis protein
MGGEMGVYSQEGEGSTFYFTLPQAGAYPLIDEQQLGGRLILSIEDDEKVIDLYKKYLKPHGFRIVPLTHAENVLSQVLQMMPYAITLDVMMSEGKGWEILETLTGNPATRQIPVIICTILEERERARILGARDYVLKPMREEDLVNAMLKLSAEPQSTRQRILVIDDDPNVMHLVEKATRRERQIDLEYVQGGQKGLEAVADTRPDAVILDLFMPDLDGFSFLDTLHKDPELKNIPVVVLTGAELTESEKRRLERYDRDLLYKGSFKAEELITSLARAITHKASS